MKTKDKNIQHTGFHRNGEAGQEMKLLRLLILCLLTVFLTACQPDELMDNRSTAQPNSPATLVLDLGAKPGYEAEASGTSGNSASTRTSPLTGQWQAGDCVTVRLTLYAADDATLPLDAAQTGNIGANSDGTLTQTLTCTAAGTSSGTGNPGSGSGSGNGSGSGSNSGPDTPAQWTAQPAVLPLPAAARALSAEYTYTGPEDPITHTRERITGTLAPRRIALTDADTQSPPDGRPRTLHLPAPQWTRRTALVQLCRLMPDRAILALTFASSDTPQAERDAAHATATYFIVAPPAQNPPEGMTADQYATQGTTALLHLPCDDDAQTAAATGAGAAAPALPLFALNTIGQPTAPAYDALQNPDAARPYAPGWKRTVDDAETVFLRTGPDADAQGTIYGDGLNPLLTDLFNGLDNPRWIISGGGTDNDPNNTGKTKNQTVEENVVTALKNIFKMVQPGTGPGSRYDGTNGYVHLTLADVTEVADNAFQYGQQLRSLSLPAVESIGSYAFNGCYGLTTASLPQVQSIGNNAFYTCTALTTVNLPKVQSIGEGAFISCNALTSLSLPQVRTIEKRTFSGCRALTALYLPEVQSIGDDAFTGTALTTLSLPKAESIGDRAFINCHSLTILSLPEARSIGESAFAYCYALTGISLPKAQSIGSNAFNNCYALTTLSLPKAQSIGTRAFDACPVLTHLDISGVTDENQVHANAFSGIGYDQYLSGGNDRTNQCTLILNPALRPACTDADGGTTGPLVRFHDCRWKEIQFLE